MATATTLSRPLGVRAYLTALGNETVKGLRHAWAERVQILIGLPLFGAFLLLLLGFLLGRGEQVAATGRLDWSLDPHLTTWLFVGFVPFTFFYLHVVKLFWRPLTEIQNGTLEQVYLSPLPSWLIAAAGRTVAAVVETVVGGRRVVRRHQPGRRPRHRLVRRRGPPLLSLVVGSVGYSLVIGGLTLLWKRIEMLQEGLLTAVMVFSGAFVTLDRLPDWAATTGRLMPVTDAIAALRTTLLDDQSLGQWGDSGLARLAITAGAWLLAGASFFRFAERLAKREGSLSRY